MQDGAPFIRLVHERTTHQDRAAECGDRHARSANATYGDGKKRIAPNATARVPSRVRCFELRVVVRDYVLE